MDLIALCYVDGQNLLNQLKWQHNIGQIMKQNQVVQNFVQKCQIWINQGREATKLPSVQAGKLPQTLEREMVVTVSWIVMDCRYQHVVDTPVHLQPIHILMVFLQNSVDMSTVRHVWACLSFTSERFFSTLNCD